MTRSKRFHGGVHPHDEEKARTRSLPIETAPAPAVVVLPLLQHIGAPAKPVVKKGDQVLRGQMVAEPGGFVSVPVHSPISGKVLEIGKCTHPLGIQVDAISIENDGQDRAVDGFGEPQDTNNLDAKAICERIRDAGICGMGGAGFPTHVKLSPPPEKPIDTLILNGAECEPALSADHRLMLECSDGVIAGARLLQRALTRDGKSPKTFIAVEENKLDAAEALRASAKKLSIDCEVVTLPVRYPQGAEKQLIYALTGRKVPPQSEKGLPMDVGVVVQNVGTAYAVYEALERKKPLVERVLTIAGDAVGRAANVRARLGTPIRELLAGRDVITTDHTRFILGGPMMGLAQFTDDFPVMKTTSGVLIERIAAPTGRFGPCIRCGRCVEACPMQLVPTRLSVLAEAGLFVEMGSWGAVDCIECGCCAYVCPARRPIVQQVKLGKWMLAQAQKKAQVASGAKGGAS